MVIRVDVVHRALTSVVKKKSTRTRIILLTPRGKTFDQRAAKRLMRYDRLVLIAGRYEAIDARVDQFVDEKISIGNFVLTGGELAAACVVDAVARLIPGVVGKEESTKDESFTSFSKQGTYVEYPQYTKPEVFRGSRVPAVLLSGHHGKIGAWRGQRRKPRKVALF
jgi:tRNA (guanine37-N1)-methyltransferase